MTAPLERTVLDEHPVVDRFTERVGVIAVDRPVVSLSTAVVGAVQAVIARGRGVQLLTPATSRLTSALRTLLTDIDASWIVHEPTGCYEGLLGPAVRWDGAGFVVDDERPAPSYLRDPATSDRQLTVALHVMHPPDASAPVGGAVTTLTDAITGAPPAGWGTAEPVTEPWCETDLAAFARRRSPQRTRLTFRGAGDRPLEGIVEIARVGAGVEESVTAFVGLDAGDDPRRDVLADVTRLVAERHALISMLTAVAPGRRDLTHAPHATAPATPLDLAVGVDAIDTVDLATALTPGDGISADVVGQPAHRAVHYRLAGADQLAHLVEHLGISDTAVVG